MVMYWWYKLPRSKIYWWNKQRRFIESFWNTICWVWCIPRFYKRNKSRIGFLGNVYWIWLERIKKVDYRRSKIMKYKKICFIPIWGSIIYFFIIVTTLKKENCFNMKKTSAYMFIMCFMGFIGMIMSGLILRVLNQNNQLLFYILGFIFIWVLITIPVMNFSKEAERLLNKDD